MVAVAAAAAALILVAVLVAKDRHFAAAADAQVFVAGPDFDQRSYTENFRQ